MIDCRMGVAHACAWACMWLCCWWVGGHALCIALGVAALTVLPLMVACLPCGGAVLMHSSGCCLGGSAPMSLWHALPAGC